MMKSHIPRKRFGQNFLNSPGIIRKIVAAIAHVKAWFKREFGADKPAVPVAAAPVVTDPPTPPTP